MRFYGLLLCISLLFGGLAPAADEANARTIIDAAIRAHGGEAALAKFPVVTATTQGIFQGFERTPVFFFTGVTTTHGAEHYRSTLDGKLHEQPFHVVNVLNREHGWIEMSGNGKQEILDATPSQMEEFRERGYLSWISSLVPLKDPKFTLTATGEQTDSSRPLVGVRVSHPQHRDVTLYFDRDTHLLTKSETQATAGTGKPGKVETLFGRHKMVEGVLRPMHWTVYYNGAGLISHDVQEYKLAQEPNAETFAKPVAAATSIDAEK